jgi:multiple sugar transport system substrate-binding protein
MTTRHRWLRLLPALALLAAGAVACGSNSDNGGDPTAQADPKADVHLVWWTGQETEQEKILDGLAKQFHEMHPNVTIDVSSGASTTDDLLQKMSATFASGKFPDISYAYGSWASELHDTGKTLDITQKVAEAGVNWGEFPAAARATATVDGQVIGFPSVVDNLGLIYNTKLFDAAGVAYPTDSWTWDDFRAAAKKLTDPAKKQYGTAYSVAGTEDTTWHLWPLLWQRGGQVLSADSQHATFNSAAGVGALDLLRSMAVDDKSVYLDQTDQRYPALFQDGHIGMMISGPWELFELQAKKTPYGVSILPGTNGDHQTVSGPDIWVLLDHGDANRAYWSYEFTKWLTSAPIDAKWNLAQGNLPLRSSESSLPEYGSYVKQYPGADVFFRNLSNARTPRPTVSGYVSLSTAVGKAISTVLQGAAGSKDALDKAAKTADQGLGG